jgi:hypothetical protein
MTGAHVQLGVARPGALLITSEPWALPGRSPLWLVDRAEGRAGDGKSAVLLIGVEGDEFLLDVAQR